MAESRGNLKSISSLDKFPRMLPRTFLDHSKTIFLCVSGRVGGSVRACACARVCANYNIFVYVLLCTCAREY